MTTRDLEGITAIVTGAGRGFGRAVAQRLATAGAHLGLIARSGDELEEASDAIRGAGGSASHHAVDVTDREAVVNAFGTIERDSGPVSVLVNNAGTLNAVGPTWEIDPDAWWREVEIHLRGSLLCSHAALTSMVPRGSGRIVNVGGLLGQQGEPYSSAYSSAKAAIYRLTECLANEVRGSGVSVFCMSPGPVLTGMTRPLAETDAGRRWLPEFGELPDEQWVAPEVGAELVYRLARGDADRLSGRALHVMFDLDEMIAEADDIGSGDRAALRILP